MDSKAKKQALKRAKEKIQVQDFNGALAECRGVLVDDRTNYNALVLTGFAADKLGFQDEAEDAYKHACTISPGEELAWKGLCTIYEKSSGTSKLAELQDCYRKLLVMTSDQRKKDELYMKLHTCVLRMPALIPDAIEELANKARDVASNVVNEEIREQLSVSLVEFISKRNPSHLSQTFGEVISTITRLDALSVRSLTVYSTWLSQITSDPFNLFSKLCDLYKISEWKADGDMDKLKSHLQTLLYSITLNAAAAGEIIPSVEPDVLSTLSDNHLQVLGDVKEGKSQSIDSVDSLLADQNSLISSVLTLLKAEILLAAGQLSHDASAAIFKVIAENLPCIPACLMEKCSDCYKSRIQAVRLKLAMQYDDFHGVADIIQSNQNLLKDPELQSLYQESVIELGQWDRLDPRLEKEQPALFGYSLFKRGKLEQAVQILTSQVSSSPTSQTYQWLGEVCLQMNDKAQLALKYQLMAAKLDDKNGKAFLYLGMYYEKHNQHDRSLKCYKKAYSICPYKQSICQRLVDALIKVQQVDEAMALLTEISSRSATTQRATPWVWIRLGILHSRKGDNISAINCLQQALRNNERDSTCWQCLGDAYFSRGSFESAAGAFGKAIEVHPTGSCVYSSYRLAMINFKLGNLVESRELFEQILKEQPDYVPALKGLAEVDIADARKALYDDIVPQRAIDNIQHAAYRLHRCVKLTKGQLVCVWKRLGDCLILSYDLPLYCRGVKTSLSLPDQLVSNDGTQGCQKCDIEVAVGIAARCYAQALHHAQDDSSIWYDISVSQLYLHKLTGDKQYVKTAIRYCENVLHLEKETPSSDAHSLLGVLYQLAGPLCDAMLSQHHFIRAVEIDPLNVKAWTNLASLYLQQNEVGLAHEALKIAQAAVPLYTQAWLGQARVAEMLKPVEAMDLYRHSTELSGFHEEAAKGYTRWVLKSLLDTSQPKSAHLIYALDRLGAVSVACDSMDRLNRMRESLAGLNAQSLLLERQSMKKAALDVLDRCKEVADIEQPGEPLPVQVQTNTIRLQLGENPSEALATIASLGDSVTLSDLYTQALASYKLGSYTDAFAQYQLILDKVPDDQKPDVYAALGMIAAKLNDLDTAKAAFLSCSQSTPSSSHGLSALCSFGLLTGDTDLALAAHMELTQLDSSSHRLRTAQLNALIYKLKGEWKMARNALLKYIHSYPTDSLAYKPLLEMSINQLPEMRRSVLRLVDNTSDGDLASLAWLAEGDPVKAFRLAMKAVRMDPTSGAKRLQLLTSLQCKSKLQSLRRVKDDELINDATPLSDTQKVWLKEMKILTGDSNNVDQLPELSERLQVLLSAIQGSNREALTQWIVVNPDDTAAWVLYSELCGGDITELLTLIQVASGKSKTCVPSSLLALSIHKNIQQDSNPEYDKLLKSHSKSADNGIMKLLGAIRTVDQDKAAASKTLRELDRQIRSERDNSNLLVIVRNLLNYIKQSE